MNLVSAHFENKSMEFHDSVEDLIPDNEQQKVQLSLRNSRSYTSHHRDNNTLPPANDLRNLHQHKQSGHLINKDNV